MSLSSLRPSAETEHSGFLFLGSPALRSKHKNKTHFNKLLNFRGSVAATGNKLKEIITFNLKEADYVLLDEPQKMSHFVLISMEAFTDFNQAVRLADLCSKTFLFLSL